MKLKAVIHEAEEGGYWAEIPAVPGCATQGNTFEELLTNLYEAVEACLSIDERGFPNELLEIGRLNCDWAAIRLLEYGAYADIIRLLGFAALVQGWPDWRHRIRFETRRRGFDFLVKWLPRHHPELLS